MANKIKLAVMALAALSLTSCQPDSDTAMRALRSAGYESITLNSYPFFECGQDDHLNVGFTARNATGLYVEGAVCCGWLKDCTVRTR